MAFSHAFCAIPICPAARAGLLAGVWPTTHGSPAIASSEPHHPTREVLGAWQEAYNDGAGEPRLWESTRGMVGHRGGDSAA